MQLTEEERNAIVVHRLEKADDFLDWTQEDVEPYVPKAKAYIEKI